MLSLADGLRISMSCGRGEAEKVRQSNLLFYKTEDDFFSTRTVRNMKASSRRFNEWLFGFFLISTVRAIGRRKTTISEWAR